MSTCSTCGRSLRAPACRYRPYAESATSSSKTRNRAVFRVLPAQKHHVGNGSELLYVTVPMPTLVRNQQAGINAIVVALPEAQARDVFRDLTPRLLFAGAIGLAAATLVGLVLWASLYRPLGRVTRGIRALAGGNYRDRVRVSVPSEVRALAEAV